MTIDHHPGLGGIELLSVLDGKTLREIETQCRWHEFAVGQTVLHFSDETEHSIYFVIKGSARIVNYSESGREIAFANVHEGGYFGELAALTDNPRSASVVAVTDCLLASLAPRIFQSLLLDNPKLGLQVIMRLANIIQRCDMRIMNLSTLTAVQRIHVELLRLAKRDATAPGDWVVRPLPTAAHIASQVSTTRETVTRAMTQLTVAGVTERKGKSLYIRDHDRLAELAESGAAQMIATR